MSTENETGELQIMSAKGHNSIKWSPKIQSEVDLAEEMFDSMIEKGYSAFRVGRGGERGERISEFDSKASEIIMVPRISGG